MRAAASRVREAAGSAQMGAGDHPSFSRLTAKRASCTAVKYRNRSGNRQTSADVNRLAVPPSL
jgi:hypothetical protein